MLGVTNTTLMRRMDRLEHQLGTKLFVRHQAGLMLSEAGKSILDDVKEMERLSFNVFRTASQSSAASTGRRVAVTEGPGTYWVLPRLIDFQNTYQGYGRPALRDGASRRRPPRGGHRHPVREPNQSGNHPVTLGRLHIYPFVSEAYRNSTACPRRRTQEPSPGRPDGGAGRDFAYARVLGINSLDGITGIKHQLLHRELYAVERGAGIGFLPTSLVALGADLVAVDLGVHHHADLWLAYHKEFRNSDRHKIVIDWLKKIFDPDWQPVLQGRVHSPQRPHPADGRIEGSYGLDGYAAANPLKAARQPL